jgi:hypothetical protein
MLGLQERDNLLQPIPDQDVCLPYNITICHGCVILGYRILFTPNDPSQANYNDLKGTDTIARLLLQEAFMDMLCQKVLPWAIPYWRPRESTSRNIRDGETAGRQLRPGALLTGKGNAKANWPLYTA